MPYGLLIFEDLGADPVSLVAPLLKATRDEAERALALTRHRARGACTPTGPIAAHAHHVVLRRFGAVAALLARQARRDAGRWRGC